MLAQVYTPGCMCGTFPRTIARALRGAALLVVLGLAHPAWAETKMLPPVGGVSYPADAMIFYVARGAADACRTGCSEWIAAEGAVQWDTYKRLLALLERLGGRKLPVILKVHGEGNLNVATTLGRIIRDRGLDTAVGSTRVAQCHGLGEPECAALKRGRGPLDGDIDGSFAECGLACVLILAGGVKRTLAAHATVVIGGMRIRNRLAPNVSPEHTYGLTARFSEQFRIYLKEMGVSPEVVDIMGASALADRPRRLSRDDWMRLRIATE
jgi:hypothetical protein